MMNYTEGNWTVRPGDRIDGDPIIVEVDGCEIAHVISDIGDDMDVIEGNARLMASSPGLWEIVRLLAEREDADDPLIQDAIALVTKIEGGAA